MSYLSRFGFCITTLFAIVQTASAGGLIVPAYVYPTKGGAFGDDWYQFAAAAAYLKANGHNGHNTLIAIGNVNSGPGTAVDANYVSAFAAVRSNGGKIIGYVDTNNAQNSLASVKSQIDLWVGFYGKQLDGIFLDNWRAYQPGNVPGTNPAISFESYYDQLWVYIKDTKKLSLLCGNPGTIFDPTERDPKAAHLADILMIHEDSYSTGTNWALPAWTKTPAVAQVGAIYHGLPKGDQMIATNVILDTIKTKEMQWVFVTDDTLANNPYGLLPGVFSGGTDGQWNSYWGNEQYATAFG
jgi:Spherulation-specific family 4